MSNRRLLVINFAMDEQHPVLGFGVSWVRALARQVDYIDVVTGSVGDYDVPPNVSVHDAGWRPGEDVTNSLRLRSVVRRTLSGRPHNAVFTHMAAPFAALVGPDLRLRRLRHVLWYAHASRSKGLLMAYPWVNAIATSTPESCPMRGSKVRVVGQGIDVSLFRPKDRLFETVESAVHWGRADPSKRLEHVAAAVESVRHATGHPQSLHQVGSPSTPAAEAAWSAVLERHQEDGTLLWTPGVPREQLPDIASGHDVFLHAFSGSMDKAALEAAASGLPVLSENASVRREIGAWPGPVDLAAQLLSFVQADPEARAAFSRSQQDRVRAKHSLDSLATRLLDVIYPS